MRRISVTAGIGIVCLFATPTAAQPWPGLDCSKVESAAARLICNDKNLMNAYDAFRVVLQNSVERTPDGPIKGAMLREHFAWVKERNTRCGLDGKDNATLVELSSAKTCLLGALNERTDYLRSQ